MTRSHDERCKECKANVGRLLAVRFGAVKTNCDLHISSRLEDYKNSGLSDVLSSIYSSLQRHRGFENFIRSKKLKPVDFYLPEKSLIVEFDESQHFTKAREIALSLYPQNCEFGFSVDRWRMLCQKLDKRDNDPPFRDEQRSWYDTLRDFAPLLSGIGKTIRLYSRDLVWCSLKLDNESDFLAFDRLFHQLLAAGNDDDGQLRAS